MFQIHYCRSPEKKGARSAAQGQWLFSPEGVWSLTTVASSVLSQWSAVNQHLFTKNRSHLQPGDSLGLHGSHVSLTGVVTITGMEMHTGLQ